MKQRILPLLCMALLLPPDPVAAHLHVFVDTGIEVVFDAGGVLTHVRVTWAYDAFYSLLITEDMGLDPDYDGVLTASEIDALSGFDMQWIEGFNGDLEIIQNDRVLSLGDPQEATASFADGRITTTHLRALEPGIDIGTQPIMIKPYDETYYTAYDVTLPVEVTGRENCRARVQMPDVSPEMRAMKKELSTLDADAMPEDAGLPNIGGALAQSVKVTCAAP